LSDLLGGGPVQNPSLPQSTTFSPIVTGGVDPFIAPQGQSNKPAMSVTNHSATFNTVRYMAKNLATYIGFFIGAVVISMSTPRSLILQYIPNTYTSGGVPSYTGVAILGAVAVAIAYVAGTLLGALF
jgi:hypothetical protein